MLHACNRGIIAKCSSSFGVFAFLRLRQLIAVIAIATCDNTNELLAIAILRSIVVLRLHAGALFVMLQCVVFLAFDFAHLFAHSSPFISFLSFHLSPGQEASHLYRQSSK